MRVWTRSTGIAGRNERSRRFEETGERDLILRYQQPVWPDSGSGIASMAGLDNLVPGSPNFNRFLEGYQYATDITELRPLPL